MIFHECRLKGAYIIELNKMEDDRGYFARTFCKNEFASRKLDINIVQCNISYNKKRGTIRGMHFQSVPYEESKIVSCIKGGIYDVIIDLREGSPTCFQWESFELTEDNKRQLFIPKGFAHGFETTCGDTEVFYQMTEFYHPECAKGIKWDDPYFDIRWPIMENITISEKDTMYRPYQ